MEQSLDKPAIPVSIRINPFKPSDLSHLGDDGAVPWCPQGRYLPSRPSFTLDPLFHAGAYYVQDASAMFVGWIFRQVLERFGGRKVLDLCAAPGGKTTDAAVSLREKYGPDFILVSNEVIRARAAVLQDNVAIWGDPNVVVSSSDPSDFKRLGEYFDIIIADVPCSGEGMFRKSENARQMWSEDNVALCASRQKRIVADAWEALAPGGVLVYSTCTMNDAENDDNVAWIAAELGGEPLRFEMNFDGPETTQYGFRLVPGVVRGEGQYCAAVRKPGGTQLPSEEEEKEPFDASALANDAGVQFFDRSGEIFALPDAVAAQMPFIGKKINVLNAGVHSFSLKGRDRIPCADLALSTILDPEDFPAADLTRQEALKFLHKDAMSLKDSPTGFVVMKYEGLPIGFVKNIGNRANNLHPASRRILMNVE